MDKNGHNGTCFDGIDAAQGIARFGGNKDRYLKNLRKFGKLLDNSFPQYEGFMSETEAEAASVNLHSIKGVAGNLGATRIFELVKAFEASVKSGAPDRDLYTQACEAAKSAAKDILEKTEHLE